MQQFEQLLPGNYYHIYNRGINSCNLFHELSNYEHFLVLYDKYISPIAETYAWVLMPNHFHTLVRIKEDVVYTYSNADRSNDAVWFENHKWETMNLSDASLSDSFKIPKPHLHFSHLFNSYTKYFNTRYNRHGSLFERPFKRNLIDNGTYLKSVVMYIHNNAVHHGFCNHPLEYPWSSYLTCISLKPTKLKREKVIEWFEDIANFKSHHNCQDEIQDISDWLEI